MAEKFHLPVVESTAQAVAPIDEHSVEREQSADWKIARAFLFNRYPLTEEGEKLRMEADEALKRYDRGDRAPLRSLKNKLPTVEHPHLELFQDFDLSKEDRLKIFGPDLACVQVTKGCRHQCEHCAADAGKQVTYMPFVAVLKIAETRTNQQRHLEGLFQEWKNIVVSALEGTEREAWEALKEEWASLKARYEPSTVYTPPLRRPQEDLYASFGRICSFYVESKTESYATEARKISGKALAIYERILSAHTDLIQSLKEARILSNDDGSFFYRPSFSSLEKPSALTHYFDSDPFDYRDTTFLHEDGSPADYGDVVLAHMALVKHLCVTTAGWPKNDQVAQAAAEKVVAAFLSVKQHDSDRRDSMRVSLHPFERGVSKGNFEAYREDMENVFRTLARIHTDTVLLRIDDPKQRATFTERVLKPLAESLKSVEQIPPDLIQSVTGRTANYLVSRFSGRARNMPGSYGGSFDEPPDYDIMACMPGFHIWPDGSVAKQGESRTEGSMRKGLWSSVQEPGTRPRPTGLKLYSLRPKEKKK